MISALYVVAYLGSALPVVGVGAVATRWGLATAVPIFGGLVALACVTIAAVALRLAHRRELGPA